MKQKRRRAFPAPAVLTLLLGVAGAPPTPSAEPDTPRLARSSDDASESQRAVLMSLPEIEGAEYAEGGVRACLECHDETEAEPVLGILQTPHGLQGDSRTPLAQPYGCQVCHGPSAAHVKEPAEGAARAPVPIDFESDSETPVEIRNQVCLSCHQGGLQMNWAGSPHESHQVACTSCHQVHAQEDPMLAVHLRPETWRREGQMETCFQCHPQQRAQMHRLSSHPIKEGKVRCSDCHNPHGSVAEHQLAGMTLNQTCYQCHAEKRGPFLWEHAPVREDCGLCHEPHGSNHRALLDRRTPWLCQQCHMAPFHPSTAYSGSFLPGGGSDGSKFLGKDCLNCHVEIHGSNHPSGVRFTR